MISSSKIGIIAGNGQFPILVAQSAREKGLEVIAVGFPDETRKELSQFVDEMHWVKLGQLNKLIKIFKKARVTDAVMAGGVTKTKLFSKIRPDWRAIRLLSRLDANRDDAILRAVAAELESEGIKIHPSTLFLESILASPGIMTRRKPNKRERADIEYGWKLAKEVGKLDIGQCLIVKEKAVLAVEGIDGTDATILRGGKLGKGGAVVIKASKPIQDLRFDVPAVGLNTIRTMIEAGASVLVLEAGKTIMFDREEMIRLANKNKISIVAISDDGEKRTAQEEYGKGEFFQESLLDATTNIASETPAGEPDTSCQKTKVAVIGVGYLGKYHAEKYARIETADLVGVIDIVAERAENVARRLNTDYFTNYHEIMDRVDAVSIVVPTSDHFRVAHDFLEAGKHVLLEKPMTRDLDEARKLENLAKEKGVVLQIGHLERFNPAVQAMLPLINSPMFIEAHRLALYKERGTEVDVILDLMIHDIDIILHIVNSPLKEIHASGVPVLTDLPDIANVRLRFENGCTANITASRISTKSMRKIRIFQPDSYLSVDYAGPDVMLLRKVGAADESGFPEIDYEKPEIDEYDALESEIKSFIDAVINGKEPVVSAADGRKALEVALAISDQIKKQWTKRNT